MAKIVIIEDENLILKVYSIQLLSAGFEVMAALDGDRGLELIKAEKPDLVLLDLNIPKVSGFGVLEYLKEDPVLHKIPVIVLSSIDQKEEQKRAFQLGALDYFTKSNADLKALVAKIKSILFRSP